MININILFSWSVPKLIHSANPQSRPVVIIIAKQNNGRYWRDCGPGLVDHWWHPSCIYYWVQFPLTGYITLWNNRYNDTAIIVFDSWGWPTVKTSIVVIIFARVVCTSVPTFHNLSKQNKFQARVVIAPGGTVGLAEWIIGDKRVFS